MDRRSAIAWLALMPFARAALAFNVKPLDQYRRHHLFILVPADDAVARAFAERVAGILSAKLPDSRAESVPVADATQVATFLVSRQFDVGVMTVSAAEALAAGRPPFAGHGPLPLKVLHAAGGHVLVARTDFLELDARRISDALAAS